MGILIDLIHKINVFKLIHQPFLKTHSSTSFHIKSCEFETDLAQKEEFSLGNFSFHDVGHKYAHVAYGR